MPAGSEHRLAALLTRFGATPDSLLANVEEGFGTALVVVATGSVVHGFGNRRSDLDMTVVVDQDKLASVPFMSFDRGILHDATYCGAREAKGWLAMRHAHWPPPRVNRASWYGRRNELFHSVRFAHGVPLSAAVEWDAWLTELREPWLANRVGEWWTAEVARWWLAGQWLGDVKPFQAAQCKCQAVLAALDRRAAAAGELYFKAKWLPEKLRRLEDPVGLELLSTALRLPRSPSEVDGYGERCAATLAELSALPHDGAGLAAQLWYAPGVRIRRTADTTLVSRWDLRGLELRDRALRAADPAEPIWQGGLDEAPEPWLLALFLEDMTWLSVVTTPT